MPGEILNGKELSNWDIARTFHDHGAVMSAVMIRLFNLLHWGVNKRFNDHSSDAQKCLWQPPATTTGQTQS
jgi:hypothetical protein